MNPRQVQRGLTLIELLISLSILAILAAAVLPLSQMTVKRGRELELRRELRVMRTAIDRFKRDWDERRIARTESGLADELNGYPVNLEVLVAGAPSTTEGASRLRYLRRLPVDPTTGESAWRLRCYDDPPDAALWCGKNVYDVASASEGVAIDGTPYADW